MKRKPDHGFPGRDAIVAFIRANPGKVGTREIAREFGLKNDDRIALKRLLRDPHEAVLARLSAGPGDSEQTSLLAAAAAARLRLASSPPEAASQSEPIGAPSVPDASAERRAGIHALEVYTPRHAVDAAELEKAHDVPGKYTEGLMMREWSACDEDEDVVTMALTAVRRLVERCGVRWEDIGMLQVGSTLRVCYCSSLLRERLQHALRTSCACTA